jgi:hypothetical protein
MVELTIAQRFLAAALLLLAAGVPFFMLIFIIRGKRAAKRSELAYAKSEAARAEHLRRITTDSHGNRIY